MRVYIFPLSALAFLHGFRWMRFNSAVMTNEVLYIEDRTIGPELHNKVIAGKYAPTSSTSEIGKSSAKKNKRKRQHNQQRTVRNDNSEFYRGIGNYHSPHQIKNANTTTNITMKTPSFLSQWPSNPSFIKLEDRILQGDLWDGSPIVIPSHKFIFLTTPKVSCTVFKQLFRRMMGYQDWSVQQNTLPHNPTMNGLIYLSHYKDNLDYINYMLNSPEWTFAVFVRDPKERMVSAYLDKAKPWYLSDRCCGKFNLTNSTPGCGGNDNRDDNASGSNNKSNNTTTAITIRKAQKLSMPFETWLKALVPACPDHHWTPQYHQLPDRLWPTVDFIGRFEDLYKDTKDLLQRLSSFNNNKSKNNTTTSPYSKNAWEEYGASGWGPFGNYSIFDPRLESSVLHRSNAKTLLQDIYTPETEAWVEDYYSEDFQFDRFGFLR